MLSHVGYSDNVGGLCELPSNQAARLDDSNSGSFSVKSLKHENGTLRASGGRKAYRSW